jgi:diguanylate cyclase (GGDEF)-like protein
MFFFNKKLLLLSFLVIGFVLTFVVINFSSEYSMNKAYQQITSKQAHDLSKSQITEIVSTAISTANTALENGYKFFYNKLESKSNDITILLGDIEKNRWCEVLERVTHQDKYFYFSLKKDASIVCQSSDYPEHMILNQDLQSDAQVVSQLEDNHTFSLFFKKEKIHTAVKERLEILFLDMKFKNPDIYIWVNEVKNYEGGDGYAIRRIHPNPKESEGLILSTNIEDIERNLPYKEELEGIKKDGEVYLEYFFKRKTTGKIEPKMTYAKLFKPFDWIIATGIYVDDIHESYKSEEDALDSTLKTHHYAMMILLLGLSVLLISLLYKKERYELQDKEQELEREYALEKVKNYQQVLYSMLDLVEKRDTYTAGHTQRVARYAVLIAEAMHLPQEQIDLLFESAIMHDIGKVSTPDSILLKPGKLSNLEYEIIKEHLNAGYEILNSIEAFVPHAQVMRDHHERWDGRGYPRGLKGDEISLLSHILILVDAFDAMTSKRIYKASKSLEEALEEVSALQGKQFSPKVVAVALDVLKKNGVIPAETDYLGTSVEVARVSYYYKDALTETYNYRFLEHILFFTKRIQNAKYQCCNFIQVKNFHKYNKKYGWLQGDEKLKDIANRLQNCFQEALIFRVYGDDFLIINEKHYDIEKEKLIDTLDLRNGILNIELHHIKLDKIKAQDFVEFSNAIKAFIDSIKSV